MAAGLGVAGQHARSMDEEFILQAPRGFTMFHMHLFASHMWRENNTCGFQSARCWWSSSQSQLRLMFLMAVAHKTQRKDTNFVCGHAFHLQIYTPLCFIVEDSGGRGW